MKIIPSIHHYPHLPGGWNHIAEVAEILGDTRSNVFKRYLPLSDDGFCVAVTNGSSVLYSTTYQKDAPFVVAGWGRDLLKAHRDGIHRVVMVEHEHTPTFFVCPEGTIPWAKCILNGRYFEARVGLTKEGRPYWTYAECQHTYGTKRVANFVNDMYVQQDRCLRCGAVVGGGR